MFHALYVFTEVLVISVRYTPHRNAFSLVVVFQALGYFEYVCVLA